MACFYGVLFRRRIRKIFPFGEIQGVEKELRFKLFPSAIRITMNNGQVNALNTILSFLNTNFYLLGLYINIIY